MTFMFDSISYNKENKKNNCPPPWTPLANMEILMAEQIFL